MTGKRNQGLQRVSLEREEGAPEAAVRPAGRAPHPLARPYVSLVEGRRLSHAATPWQEAQGILTVDAAKQWSRS